MSSQLLFRILALLFAMPDAGHASGECTRLAEAHLVVRVDKHEMALCRDRQPVRRYDVRLASGGVGKTRAGDKKTPLGWYSLGAPHRSRRYGLFVPIDYPTPEQRKQGFSGGSIGIHGPDRRVRWLGRANNWFDTTDGCIGLAKDEQMEAVIAWLKETRASRILIE